jgi:hypothetical protein
MAKWSEEEEEFLRDNYKDYTDKELAEKINKEFDQNRSSKSIKSKRGNLTLRKEKTVKNTKWTTEQVKFLKNNYSQFSNKKLVKLFNKEFNLERSRSSIQNKGHKMGLEKEDWWGKKTEEFLKENYSKINNKKLTKIFNNKFNYNRDRKTITAKANRMGLVKDNWWEEKEVEFLKKNFPDKSDKEVVKLFNKKFNKDRTKTSIQKKARSLNLTKSLSYSSKWTKEQEKFLEDEYSDKFNRNLVKLINNKFDVNRSRKSIEDKAREIGLNKNLEKINNKWTQEEVQFLKDNYNQHADSELCQKINEKFNKDRSKCSISHKRQKLNLIKRFRSENKYDLNSYYGENWNTQRNSALERDNYKCIDCGMGNEDHIEKYGCELHVDHIIPRRKFIDTQGKYCYNKGNRLVNLQTLCIKCHPKIECQKEEYIL